MSNKITFTFNVTGSADPQKLGEAIAALIKAVTPEDELAEVAAQIKAQVSDQFRREGIPVNDHDPDKDWYKTVEPLIKQDDDDAWRDNEPNDFGAGARG